MKKFKRHKTLKELKALCKKEGLQLVAYRYEQGESDWVSIHGFEVCDSLIYSPVNGRFVGARNGKYFSSDNSLDRYKWFRNLLSFFYVEEKAKKKEAKAA